MTDSEVSLQVDKDDLERIEHAKLEKEERAEKERKENLAALEQQYEEEKLRKVNKAQEEKEEDDEEIGPVVKGATFVVLLISTIVGWLLSIGMIAAEIYLVVHFDLCRVCYIVILLQIIGIVVGTLAKWLNWYIKVYAPQNKSD